MELSFPFLQWIFFVPAIVGSLYSVLCMLAVMRFCNQPKSFAELSSSEFPPVTILKPVCGLEEGLRSNLRSACLQDYPEFQVVFSVSNPDDPALPLLEEIGEEFGRQRVSIITENRKAGPNGKINNLIGAFVQARYDIFVISDSDVLLGPRYLREIVPPLADPSVGYVCTLYRAARADQWFEKMELLTLNADFIPSVIFAYLSGASGFCLGSSVALRRDSLEEIGGFEALADYLAEDYEMGRRILSSGKKMVLVPYFVDLTVDLKDLSQWWDHQVSWDQKTKAARPLGFLSSIVTRSIPFALLFAALRIGDTVGLAVLGGALALRLATAAVLMKWGLRDGEGLKSLVLLPLRDIACLGSWVLGFIKKTVTWRGSEMTLTWNGRISDRSELPR